MKSKSEILLEMLHEAIALCSLEEMDFAMREFLASVLAGLNEAEAIEMLIEALIIEAATTATLIKKLNEASKA